MKLKELTFEVRWNDWNPLDFFLVKKIFKKYNRSEKVNPLKIQT